MQNRKNPPLWPFRLGGLFRCLCNFLLRFSESLSYLYVAYSIYNRFNWFDYENISLHVYMHIYTFPHNVFNIEIYRGGAHTFIHGETIDRRDVLF